MQLELLQQLLRPGELVSFFQPIFRVDCGQPLIHSLEALTRGRAGTNFANAAILFEYVRRKRGEPVIDRECVSLALQTASQFGFPVPVSVNVHASTFARDPQMPEFILRTAKHYGIVPDRVSVEIVEYMGVWGNSPFHASMQKLQQYGLKIGIDDIGSGESNFRMLLETRPQYVKIDCHIVQGCSRDPVRLAIIEALVMLTKRLNYGVVAEGVEHRDEFEALIGAGVNLFQGYFFKRPAPPTEIASLFNGNGCKGPTSTPAIPKSSVSETIAMAGRRSGQSDGYQS